MAPSPARFQVRFEVDGDGNVKSSLDDINRKTRETGQAADDAGKRWYNFGYSIGEAVKVGSVALGTLAATGLALVIKNSIDAQNEMAQLSAVLKSSGQDASFSAEQISAMADQIAKASAFSGGEVTNAATRLLSYSGIVTEKFAPALQVAIDQAARLGISVESSAETVGRALESPTKAAAALAQQGFGAAFTKEVRNGIAALVDAGKEAEAQQIILDILNDSYQGAAAAARDTLGGAFIRLKETAADLLEGDSGGEGLRGVRQAVEDLISTLEDPAVQSGWQALVEMMLRAASASAEVVGNLGRLIGTQRQVAQLGDGSLTPSGASTDALQQRLAQATDERARTQQQRTTFLGFDIESLEQQRKQSLTNYDNEIAALQAEIAKRQVQIQFNEGNPGDPQPALRQAATRQAIPDAEDPADRKKRLAEEAREARQLQNAYDRLMDSYGQQIAMGQQATEVARVRYATEQGALKNLTEAQKQALLAKAEYLDQMDREADLQRQLDEQEARRQYVLDDIKAERVELGLSNDQLEIRRNLLDAGVTAESSWGQAIIASTEALQKARDATHAQIDTQDALREASKDIFTGAITSADNFGDVVDDVFDRLYSRLVDIATSQLWDELFGKQGSTNTGSSGGWMAAIGSAVAGWFGGGRATGGGVRAGSIHEVAEGGMPELLRSNGKTYLLSGADGTVIPASQAASAGGAYPAAGTAIGNISVHITKDAQEDRQTATADGFGGVDIRVMLKKEMQGLVASGGLDTVNKARYGLTPMGQRRG